MSSRDPDNGIQSLKEQFKALKERLNFLPKKDDKERETESKRSKKRKAKSEKRKAEYLTPTEQLIDKYNINFTRKPLKTFTPEEKKDLSDRLRNHAKKYPDASKVESSIGVSAQGFYIKTHVHKSLENPSSQNPSIASNPSNPSRANKYVKLSTESQLNQTLLKQESTVCLLEDLTKSTNTQIYSESANEIEIFIGLDFGTTNTKVVIQESGTRQAWAIPFTDGTENPYLLPSAVYRKNNTYSLSGDPSDRHDNLKLPLIEGQLNEQLRCSIIAFIALVIRQSRAWFLNNKAANFPNNTIEWFYHLGLPAENNRDKNLVSTYKDILVKALQIASNEEPLVTKNAINSVMGTHSDQFNDYIKICPEIQAQLEGYGKSDSYDAKRAKFMMCDVGGGTVDASIVNVVEENGQISFSCLNAKVDASGINILHKKRLNWIKNSAENSKGNFSQLLNDVEKASKNYGNISIYPDSIKDYITHTQWPKDPLVDDDFYEKFNDFIHGIVIWTKTHMDDGRQDLKVAETQWDRLQFIFCGGGSLHPLYAQITQYKKFEVIRMPRPSNFMAESLSKDDDFHRLSVAYGLSLSELGKFINMEDISPISPKKSNSEWRENLDNYAK